MKRKLLLRRREVFAREILLNLCRKVYPLSHHLFFLSNFRESGELVYGHACRLRGGGRSVMYIFVHSFRDAPPCCRPSHPSPTSLCSMAKDVLRQRRISAHLAATLARPFSHVHLCTLVSRTCNCCHNLHQPTPLLCSKFKVE